MVIAVLAQCVLVGFSEQLEDVDSSNVKGGNLSAKGGLEEMGPILSLCHTPMMSKERCARDYQSICVFSLEGFKV